MSQSKLPMVDIILPYKEHFSDGNAGAVSTIAYSLGSYQTPKPTQSVTIFGTAIENPKKNVSFIGLSPKSFFWQSRNYAFAKAYLRYLHDANHTPDIIEVHGRPQVAMIIAKAMPDSQVTLYLHNDPRDMRGAKTVAEREMLANKLDGIISISSYIESCFYDGLKNKGQYKAKSFVNYSGAPRLIKKPANKAKQIFMAGRMVPEKGFLEACLGALPVLLDNPDWKICIAGGKNFTTDILSDYEVRLRDALAPLGDRAVFLGHRPLSDIREYQQQSEICIVPSLWQEPAGLTVIEALAAGSALITTNRGGIPELATGRALILDHTEISDFQQAIARLISSDRDRHALQKQAWEDYPFSVEAMSQNLEKFRLSLLA